MRWQRDIYNVFYNILGEIMFVFDIWSKEDTEAQACKNYLIFFH